LHILKLKFTKFDDLDWGSRLLRPKPRWESLQRSAIAGFPGPISREKRGEGKGYTSEKARSGREWKGREREREYGWAHMGGPPTQG